MEDKDDGFGFLNEPFKKADSRKKGDLTSKLLVILPVILTALYRNGVCDLEEEEQKHPEVDGRWSVNVQGGLGGKRGLHLITSRVTKADNKTTIVEAYKDNVLSIANTLKTLDKDAFGKWIASVGLTKEAAAEWVGSLPRA
jgi:hypothetical protein